MTLRLAVPAAVSAAALVLAGQSLVTHAAARPAAAATAQHHGPYSAARSHPRADSYYPAKGTTSLDALHYGLDLTWDDVDRELAGTARIRLRATRDESRVVLDLGKPLTVESVRLDGVAARSRHVGNKLRIQTGAIRRNSRHTLVIAYDGVPQPAAVPATRRDLSKVGWVTKSNDQAWALQEPFGAFTWYPVNDHPSDKAFYDVTVHTKKSWRGVSNGRLAANSVSGGERTMHWHLASPAASYLITIDIGPYHAYHQRGPHGLPLTYWVRPRDDYSLRLLRRTPAMLRWLEARLGRFPFDRFGDVVAPNGSAEETQTLVSIDPRLLFSASFDESTVLHEYAHQWYGDDVTPDNWRDLWLNESFAMYIQIRWEITHHRESAKKWRSDLNHDDQRLRTHDGPPGRYVRTKFASLNVYYCGARMLDRLYQRLGAKAFWSLLRGWPKRHHYGNGDRHEWIRYVDHRTGHDYRHFIHRWLDSPKSPR